MADVSPEGIKQKNEKPTENMKNMRFSRMLLST
jgi:hypothetical protein